MLVVKGSTNAQVISKRKLGSIEKDSLVWVEYRDAMQRYDLDAACFQGIGDVYVGNGGYETCFEFLCGFEETRYYGIEWRAWTERPTQELMDNTPWDDEQE